MSGLAPPRADAFRHDLLGFGEPLVEFCEVDAAGPLYRRGHGGDTANTVVAATRQGARAAYWTALGDDPFGREFLDLWRRETVDVQAAPVRPGARTGVYFVHYGPDGHVFSYDRAHSAASLVGPGDVPGDLVAQSRILHASAISLAISSSCTDAGFAAMRAARAAGALVSFDTNLRLALWSLDRARATIEAALRLADIARPGLDDARRLTGLTAPDEIADHILGLGCRLVALTLGPAGTLVATPDERAVVPGFAVEARDATGAGDTFTGAFLAEWLAGADPFRAASYGNAAAALKTLGQGAVASIPRRAAVEAFLATRSDGS